MSDETEDLAATAVKSQEQSAEVMTELFAVAQPRAVFGEPVSAGEQTVITASEVRVGMGFGYGIGRGTGPGQEEVEAAGEGSSRSKRPSTGYGIGGGGAGASRGRPVAVISVGAAGVQVEPVVDASRIALAVFTALGSMFLTSGQTRRASRR